MAIKISELTELSATPADGDLLALVDISVGETKKITVANLLSGVSLSGKTTDDLAEGATNFYLTASNLSNLLGAGNNAVLGTDPTGTVYAIPGFTIFENTGGMNWNITQTSDNTGGKTVHSLNTVIIPGIASPTSSYDQFNLYVNIDPDSSGLALGTDGSAARLISGGFNHEGTSNIGSLSLTNFYSNIGNGTDPITMGGYWGHFIFADINSGVTMNQGMQGFVFQPHVHPGAAFLTTGAYTNVFTDSANIEVVVPGWSSANFSPQIAGCYTDNGISIININPTIGTMQGNAGLQYINIAGTIDTLGTNGFTAINANPTIAHITENSKTLYVGGTSTDGDAEWIGADLDGSNINTTGNIRVLRISGDSALNVLGIECNARLNVYAPFTLASGLGQQYGNVVGGEIILPNGVSITGTDVLANNMAYNFNLGNSTSQWTPASVVGLTGLGFVGQVTGDGTVNGSINFCLGGYAWGAGATANVQRINNFYAAAVNAGGAGTLQESVLYFGDLPTGGFAGTHWGVYMDSDALENYMGKLIVGGATHTVTNSSVGIEIGGTTQALLLPRLTTTERDALTAVNGMMIYNVTDNKIQGHASAVWVDLH